MSRILLGASAAAMMLAASALSPVIAQSAPGEAAAGGPASIGTLTCGDITGLSETDASALIYYSAGYQDGLRDGDMSGAMDADNANASSVDAEKADAANSAMGGAGDAVADAEKPAPAAPAANDANGAGAAGNMSAANGGGGAAPDSAAAGTMVGGLGLQANVIVDACSRTPDALLSEVIADNGGSAGNADAAGGGAASDSNVTPGDAGADTPATNDLGANGGAASTPK